MTEEGLQYFPYDPHGPTVQRTIYQPSELLGPAPVVREEPKASPVPPARPKRPTRLRTSRKRRLPHASAVPELSALVPLWQRLFASSQPQTMASAEAARRERVAGAHDIAHAALEWNGARTVARWVVTPGR